jgi:hypothetical protein
MFPALFIRKQNKGQHPVIIITGKKDIPGNMKNRLLLEDCHGPMQAPASVLNFRGPRNNV